MNTLHADLPRRDFLKSTGALVIGFNLGEQALAQAHEGAPKVVVGPPLDQLDSWLSIDERGAVTASVGKIEAGMGISTAFAQIVAEELDVPMDHVEIRMGDTANTPDQRGTGSSNGIVQGGGALRQAGAQARLALLGMASQRLNMPVEQLLVRDGVVVVMGDEKRRLTYGELIGGRRFEMKVVGKAPTKDPKRYTLVGTPVPRRDIPNKVAATYAYMVDHKVPGMLHGRVIRPPAAHAQPVHIDTALKMPGLVKIVSKGAFVGVVCEREEQAINAARALKIEWSTPPATFSSDYDALYAHLRAAPTKVSKVDGQVGDVNAALASASKVVEVSYEFPFQSHACMGPACAIVDARADGVTVWMGGQKPYALRKVMVELLGLPIEKVHVIWKPGPGSYGMNDADDAAVDAALLSQAVGRPVRVQWMRHDGTGWDPKSPPIVVRLRGGLDPQNNATAFDWHARGYSARVRPSGTEFEGDSLAGQLYGKRPKGEDLFQFADTSYRFANASKRSDILDWQQSLGTGLRTAHLRDPDGPQTFFAHESFVDELALAAGADPVAFRLKYLTDARDRAVVQAAAEAAQWNARVGPSPKHNAAMLKGRGIAYAPRNGATVAIVAEVEVERSSGAFRVTRFVVAHDCGLVVNPSQLRGTIEANLIQTMSRAMHEQVEFDERRVLSVDWSSYPIVDMTEVPDAIDIVLLNNRPEAPPKGAGEPASRPAVAAIANALFDATGVRFRRVPFTTAAVKAGLERARLAGAAGSVEQA